MRQSFPGAKSASNKACPVSVFHAALTQFAAFCSTQPGATGTKNHGDARDLCRDACAPGCAVTSQAASPNHSSTVRGCSASCWAGSCVHTCTAPCTSPLRRFAAALPMPERRRRAISKLAGLSREILYHCKPRISAMWRMRKDKPPDLTAEGMHQT